MKKFTQLIISCFFIHCQIFSQSPNWQWAHAPGMATNGDGEGFAIAIDLSGNLYMVGEFQGSKMIFGQDTVTNYGYANISNYLTKYSPAGNVLWANNALYPPD